jgi:uncharacterized membrane protein (GlpM family)
MLYQIYKIMVYYLNKKMNSVGALISSIPCKLLFLLFFKQKRKWES